VKRLLCIQAFILKSAFLFASGPGYESQPAFSAAEKAEFNRLFWEDSLWSFRSPKGFVPMFWYNTKRQATSFLRMSEGQALMLMGAAGLTATLYYYDEEIDRYFRPLEDKHDWLARTSPVITEFGDYYGYSFLALTGVYSLVAGNHKLLHTSVMAAQSALSAGLWCRVGKIMTGRMRPGATYGDPEFNRDHWFGPFGQYNKKERGDRGVGAYDAFPSGHTAAAFSIASVFADRYSDRPAVAWISYGLATTVAITRLVEHEHWASDLIPGALIGYGCGRQILSNYRRLFPQYEQKDYRRKKKSRLSWNIAPQRNGVYCSIRF
jgi:membrane-associated phospholipid phosphatase